MRYKTLLFDLDDTLLDFGANERESLTKLFQQHGYTFSDELFQAYHRVNRQLWAEYENGSIALPEVLNTRFAKTMLALGETVDGLEWESQYREHLNNGYQLMEGALEVCRRLSETHRLFIITNGVTQTQINRLTLSGLHGFFEDIFTSQNIGFQKPSGEFFDYVMEHIPGFDRREALVIGDSLGTDIKGGILAGMDTCWVNGKGQMLSEEIKSTYVITKLADLYDLCR